VAGRGEGKGGEGGGVGAWRKTEERRRQFARGSKQSSGVAKSAVGNRGAKTAQTDVDPERSFGVLSLEQAKLHFTGTRSIQQTWEN
jgi:hypothetical protein